MSDRDWLHTMLDEARADLLAAVDACAPTGADAGWPALRDLLWRTGYVEDWRRRVIKHGLEYSAVPPLEERLRPAPVQQPAQLLAWLDQTRRPVLSLLRHMADDDLDRAVVLADGEPSSVRAQLEAIAREDRERAAEVRRIGAGAQPGA